MARTTRALFFVATIIAVPRWCSPQLDADEPSESTTSVAERIAGATEQPATALQLLKQLPESLSRADRASLRAADQSLGWQRKGDGAELSRQLLLVLSSHADEQTLGYLHEVFETQAERRHDVAEAIANFAIAERRRPADWRLLVRSLPLVDGRQATIVLRALSMFRERGTKPHWIREAILAGLRADADGPEAAEKLLEHWTGRQPEDAAARNRPMAAWQSWFANHYPEMAPAEMPRDMDDAVHRYSALVTLVYDASDRGDVVSGAKLYEKALCAKCHRFGNRGEAMGPDLTNTRVRFQRREVLQAVLFPSHAIADQYETNMIVTTDGKSFSGVVNVRGDDVIVLQSNGEKTVVAKDSVEEILTSTQSSMPNRLLDMLTPREIVDLFAYLYQSTE